jgi:hypothetical protein
MSGENCSPESSRGTGIPSGPSVGIWRALSSQLSKTVTPEYAIPRFWLSTSAPAAPSSAAGADCRSPASAFRKQASF